MIRSGAIATTPTPPSGGRVYVSGISSPAHYPGSPGTSSVASAGTSTNVGAAMKPPPYMGGGYYLAASRQTVPQVQMHQGAGSYNACPMTPGGTQGLSANSTAAMTPYTPHTPGTSANVVGSAPVVSSGPVVSGTPPAPPAGARVVHPGALLSGVHSRSAIEPMTLQQRQGAAGPAYPSAAAAAAAAAAASKAATAQAVQQVRVGAEFSMMTREQKLEQRVHELEALLAQKDQQILELRSALTGTPHRSSSAGGASPSRTPGLPRRSPRAPLASSTRGLPSGSFKKVSDSRPSVPYIATDEEDPVDVRLEEFYNATGSAVQFHRINRGFYRFGSAQCELDIINHKLMARSEDGWNRGKFGPIEKFLMHYENQEREKAGIQIDL